MNLENEENKKLIIENFFKWLFDDKRVIDKEVILESELDFTLAPYYMDSNIYYPKQIANFFRTQPMQRLGRISQLDLAIDEYPNVYHNRLQHCKGTYNRKLEEFLHNFENPSWKKYIENNNMKLYLIAELIKVAGHDIGHLPLSHALEQIIFYCRGPHEVIGKRIMLENAEIQSVLESISPDLSIVLKELYEKNILNFNEHDESNYDVDRLDYLSRDSLYAGNPVHFPYLEYETLPVMTNSLGVPELNNDGSILQKSDSIFKIDVYNYSDLKEIEHFLEQRENEYKSMYTSSQTHIREHTINALLEAFLSTESDSGKDLKKFINSLRSHELDKINLSPFLEWDDIKFYSEILDIAENNENPDIRMLASMTIPNLKAFLTMLYSHLNIHNKTQEFSCDDRNFLLRIKKIIKGESTLSTNLRNPHFAMDNTLLFSTDSSLHDRYSLFFENGLINFSKVRIRAYNPKEPIYIKDSLGKVYELSHHPNRKCDWPNRISYVESIYSYIPFLKFNGLSDLEIQDLRNLANESFLPKNSKKITINMQPLKVEHNIEDCFLEI